MGYVENSLISDEQIVYRAKIHWFIYATPFFLFLLALLYSVPITNEAGEEINDTSNFSTFLYIFATVILIRAIVLQWTTELVVTTKRVIAKFGFIRRDTIEIPHQKIESVTVKQSIFGRIFNYGSLVMRGTGGVNSPIKFIVSPFDFRRKAMEYVDVQQSR